MNRQTADHRPCIAAARGAFTLLEVTIVLIIMAVLMAVAIPALAPHEAERLRAAADMLAADLRLAKSLAIRDNTTFALTLTTSGWKVEHTGTGAAPLLPTPLLGGIGTGYEIDAAVLVGCPLRIEARLASTGTTATSVNFTATGRTQAIQDTVFWLSSGTGDAMRSVPLVVSAPTGRVSAGDLVVGPPPAN